MLSSLLPTPIALVQKSCLSYSPHLIWVQLGGIVVQDGYNVAANQKENRSPVAIDLFAGAGGLSEGLLASGVDVALAIEQHPDPALTHAFNHPNTLVMCGDIADVRVSAVKRHLKRLRGSSNLDLIAGGPPCQGFSPAGKQDRNDPRNSLFRHFVRLVDGLRPRMFLFENVPAFATLHGGKTIHAVLDAFWSIGYRMHAIDNDSEYYPDEFPELNSAWYGVPQRRRRFLLVGWRNGVVSQPFKWPSITHGQDKHPSSGFHTPKRCRKPLITVGDALSDLGYLTSGLESHNPPQPLTDYQSARSKNALAAFNHLATRHKTSTVNFFRRFGRGKTVSSLPTALRSGKQRLRRLDVNDCSPAVLALPDDYIHPRLHRIPTVREMARLQSFDDDYIFFGKRTTSEMSRRIDVPQYTQVGNAVPPLLAKAVGQSIVQCLAGQKRDLRSLNTRRRRASLVAGSSAYNGYLLTAECIDQLNLCDLEGTPIHLPQADPECSLALDSGVREWMKHKPTTRCA